MAAQVVVMRVHSEGGSLVADRVEPRSPEAGWVRVQIVASGVCNADLGTVKAHGVSTPVTPGHEIAGTIAEIGEGVKGWGVGDRVAIGWFGGSCGQCPFCQRGDVVHCAERKVPGMSYPGGWAESVVAPANALVRIPEGLDSFDAAPMGCAGVTTFNAVRNAGTPAGGRVAVYGIGGLGHLALQFAAKLGYEVVAIARGPEREALARDLGAKHYIDSAATEPGEALAALGGVDHIISTVPNTASVSELVQGLRVHGRLTLIGVDGGMLQVPVAQLVMNSQILTGHLTGGPLDIEETMQFALVHGVRPMIERMPLEEADAAIKRLSLGQPRFRIVLDASENR